MVDTIDVVAAAAIAVVAVIVDDEDAVAVAIFVADVDEIDATVVVVVVVVVHASANIVSARIKKLQKQLKNLDNNGLEKVFGRCRSNFEKRNDVKKRHNVQFNDQKLRGCIFNKMATIENCFHSISRTTMAS